MAHSRPWHRDSLFGDGPLHPLDREPRARFKYLLTVYYHNGTITPKFEKVGLALLRHLSRDGRCDPSHATLAREAGCNIKTVGRALERFKALGLVFWRHRIGRDRWRVYQRSNAYILCPGEVVNLPPAIRPARDRHFVGENSTKKSISLVQPEILASPEERRAAQEALVRVSEPKQRRDDQAWAAKQADWMAMQAERRANQAELIANFRKNYGAGAT